MNIQHNGASRLKWRVVDADGCEVCAGESYRPLRDETVINLDVDEEESRRKNVG
jgi:hypothetical protein